MDHIMELMKTNKTFKNCLATGNPTTKILNFGMHAYADTFINNNQLALTEPIIPLECYLNESFGTIQLGYITNDYDRYSLYSYSYTSSNSEFSKNHWNNYYQEIQKTFDVVGKTVVEIGSNDGYLAKQFLKNKNTVIGVDASKEMCEIAKKEGIITINRLFNIDTAKEIKDSFSTVDLIIANNVFNHSNDPLNFAQAVYNLLNENGLFIFELPYWKSTVESNRFDQIYHEHVTYFTLKYAFNLLNLVGLNIFDYKIVDYHGGSLRVYATKSTINKKVNPKVQVGIELENKIGLFNIETYYTWQKNLIEKRNIFLSKFYSLKLNNPDIPIVGIGAAAKANTFLTYYNLNNTVINYITDSSEYKQGKYTPLTRIPIVSDEIFKNYKKVYGLILSWNISDKLKEVLLKINPNIEFIKNESL